MTGKEEATMRKRAKTWTIVVKGSDGREYTFKAKVLGPLFLRRREGGSDCEPGEIALPLDGTAIAELCDDLVSIIAEVKSED